jgi:hypothetical protein
MSLNEYKMIQFMLREKQNYTQTHRCLEKSGSNIQNQEQWLPLECGGEGWRRNSMRRTSPTKTLDRLEYFTMKIYL